MTELSEISAIPELQTKADDLTEKVSSLKAAKYADYREDLRIAQLGEAEVGLSAVSEKLEAAYIDSQANIKANIQTARSLDLPDSLETLDAAGAMDAVRLRTMVRDDLTEMPPKTLARAIRAAISASDKPKMALYARYSHLTPKPPSKANAADGWGELNAARDALHFEVYGDFEDKRKKQITALQTQLADIGKERVARFGFPK